MLETIYKVSVCALIAMVFIGFEVESWPLKRVLFKKVFNRKTKTEKPLKVLVLVKSECTADCLASMISNKYNRIVVYTHGTFKATCGKIYQRRIRFPDGEYWQIVTYFEDELEYFDFNVFDKIILSYDLSIDIYQKIANRVSNHAALRVCDLDDVINAVTNKEIENHV